jgi:peptidoglycan hydrolase-like protein with peptidoglycan-binding domain
MKRPAAMLAATLMCGVLTGAISAPAHERFPVFVYTSPETIREAQQILVGLKYLEPERYKAGEWDKGTQRATRGFQRDHFLRPNGQLDRDTLAVLLSHKRRPGESPLTAAPPAATDRTSCCCR